VCNRLVLGYGNLEDQAAVEAAGRLAAAINAVKSHSTT